MAAMACGEVPQLRLASLQNVWPRICRAANLDDVRLHDLRHTFASFGVNSGQNLPVIGKLLGHTKITTTQRYAHLADDPLRQATELIGATLAATMAGRPKDRVASIHAQLAPERLLRGPGSADAHGSIIRSQRAWRRRSR